MQPFRFGLQVSNAPTPTAWRDLARRTEDRGYSTLFVPDHFEDQYGPLVALTVAAEATTNLRVGSLVFGNDYRHPLVLAKEMATLDLFSGGRVEFGLGAGWMTSDYVESGIVEDPAGVRVDRLAESLAVIKRLWTEGSVTYEGEHYRLTGARVAPGPHARPHPPVIVGGGSRRVLGIAAREADIVGINPSLASGFIGAEVAATTSAKHYDERLTWVREAAGARFDQLELQVLTFVVQLVPDRARAVADLAALMSVTEAEVEASPITLIGTAAQVADILRERRERFGLSYIVVHEAEAEAFAPVVAELAGT